jgi:cell division protein FtsI (penicillin-binding protein 3)
LEVGSEQWEGSDGWKLEVSSWKEDQIFFVKSFKLITSDYYRIILVFNLIKRNLDVKKDILWRVYLVYLGMALLCLMIVFKVFYIQNVQGKYWRGMADSLHQKFIEIEADRGTIYSEEGQMLSTSIPQFDVFIDFGAEGLREKSGKRFKENLDSLSLQLASLFKDRTKDEYKKILKKGYADKNRYFSLKKKISFKEWQQLREFPLVRLGKNKSGFIADVNMKRLNPYKLLGNRTIGLSRSYKDEKDSLITKNIGLEQAYDTVLRGKSGQRLVRYVAGGAYVPVDGAEIDPEHGHDLTTTIDVQIQDIAENALMRMMIDNECVHGTAIVMEVKTGKVRAMANLGRQPDGSYWEDYNYALMPTEPGSTFKLATTMAAIEDKFITLEDHLNINGGVWKVNGRTVYDAEQSGKSDVTVKEAFEHSSNVGMAKIAMNYYSAQPSKFIDKLKLFGMTDKTGIDLRGEGTPIVYSPARKDRWTNTTLPWMAFGYNVMVTPLQTLQLYNTIANDGKMMKPYLVSAIKQDGVLIKNIEPYVINDQLVSESTVKAMRACMEGVVTNGTGKVLRDSSYTIAGKTGTALVANGKRGYADHIYQSSFAGYFPADRPMYSCIVVIKNKPFARKFFGASVAGPVFKEISDRLYGAKVQPNINSSFYTKMLRRDSSRFAWAAYANDLAQVMGWMNMRYADSAKRPTDWRYVSNDSANRTVVRDVAMNKNIMPGVRGMGFKDVLFLCESMGLKVKAEGRGRVVAQSIAAGTAIRKGETVALMLN